MPSGQATRYVFQGSATAGLEVPGNEVFGVGSIRIEEFSPSIILGSSTREREGQILRRFLEDAGFPVNGEGARLPQLLEFLSSRVRRNSF